MATLFTSKFVSFPKVPTQPPTKEELGLHLNVVYLDAVRKYSNRAYSAEACLVVLGQLAKLYIKGKKFLEEDAPLGKVTGILGDFEHYVVPEELKHMFSNPIVLPFPPKKKKKL